MRNNSHGPKPPGWFKEQSDGCSVPTRIGKFFLRAEQARETCYVHDFEYYLTALQFHEGSGSWVGARHKADYNLNLNRALVARNRVIGWIYARMYYRFVRLFGRFAMKAAPYLFMPPSLEAIAELEGYLRTPMTPKAQAQIAEWKGMYESA